MQPQDDLLSLLMGWIKYTGDKVTINYNAKHSFYSIDFLRHLVRLKNLLKRATVFHQKSDARDLT